MTVRIRALRAIQELMRVLLSIRHKFGERVVECHDLEADQVGIMRVNVSDAGTVIMEAPPLAELDVPHAILFQAMMREAIRQAMAAEFGASGESDTG